MQVVIFKLNNEQFAVQTDKIQSINDAMEITKVPKAPAHIKRTYKFKRKYHLTFRYKSFIRYTKRG